MPSSTHPPRPQYDAELRGAVATEYTLHGTIYNDERKRFPDKELIHTSKVKEVWRDKILGHLVKTNTGTVYKVEFFDENASFKQIRNMPKVKVYE